MSLYRAEKNIFSFFYKKKKVDCHRSSRIDKVITF